MRSLFVVIFLSTLTMAQGCDTKSKAEPYADYTPQEKARVALNAKDFPEAIRLYNEVIAAFPEDYESYRFLATAYAEQGGFDILAAVSGTLSDAASDGGSLLDTLSNFLPETPSEEQITSLGLAVETIMRLPEDRRSYVNPENPTSSSAAQQLQFYQTAYSLSYLKKFTQITDAGTLDPSRLETMTDQDVDNILNNFEAIAETAGGGVVSEGVEEFISQLDAAPGGTRREKLLAYLEANPPSLTR